MKTQSFDYKSFIKDAIDESTSFIERKLLLKFKKTEIQKLENKNRDALHEAWVDFVHRMYRCGEVKESIADKIISAI